MIAVLKRKYVLIAIHGRRLRLEANDQNAITPAEASSNLLPQAPSSQLLTSDNGSVREWVTDSIEREITHDGIYIYTVATEKWNLISTWLETVVQTLEQWPKDRLCRLVYDHTRVRIFRLQARARLRAGTEEDPQYDMATLGITPEMNQRLEAIISAYPGFQIRLAVVLSSNLSARITRIESHVSELYTKRIFGTLSGSLTWLRGWRMPEPRTLLPPASE